MKRICVFCGSSQGNRPEYRAAAEEMAAELVDDNRLYRQTARNTGNAAVANVLDDLERVLIEIAHSPTEVSSGQLDDLRQQIESRGLLFKVRVLGSQVREQEVAPAQKDKNKL